MSDEEEVTEEQVELCSTEKERATGKANEESGAGGKESKGIAEPRGSKMMVPAKQSENMNWRNISSVSVERSFATLKEGLGPWRPSETRLPHNNLLSDVLKFKSSQEGPSKFVIMGPNFLVKGVIRRGNVAEWSYQRANGSPQTPILRFDNYEEEIAKETEMDETTRHSEEKKRAAYTVRTVVTKIGVIWGNNGI